MPLHTTEAIVLRTYALAEADKICVFLTRDYGKVRGVAHGARKLKSRFGSSLEPFTEVALTYYEKEGRELVSVSTCDILRSRFELAARDVETAAAFAYMAELLAEFLPDNEPNEKLYRLVAATLEAVEGGGDLPSLLRYFEVWLLKLAGFFPEVDRCAVCRERLGGEDTLFLTEEGAPRCAACSGGRGIQIDAATRRTIGELFRSHPSAFAARRLAPERVERLNDVAYRIIRHALERELRSRAFLQQLAPEK